MHPAHEAALDNITSSFDVFRTVLSVLPAEALDWKPVPTGNTIAVLVVHSISATRLWVDIGCGADRSLQEYRAGERAEAFGLEGRSATELNADIDACLEELRARAQDAGQASLDRVFEPDVPDFPPVNGYTALVRAAAHVREHAGEAQLTRDLWLAR